MRSLLLVICLTILCFISQNLSESTDNKNSIAAGTALSTVSDVIMESNKSVENKTIAGLSSAESHLNKSDNETNRNMTQLHELQPSEEEMNATCDHFLRALLQGEKELNSTLEARTSNNTVQEKEAICSKLLNDIEPDFRFWTNCTANNGTVLDEYERIRITCTDFPDQQGLQNKGDQYKGDQYNDMDMDSGLVSSNSVSRQHPNGILFVFPAACVFQIVRLPIV